MKVYISDLDCLKGFDKGLWEIYESICNQLIMVYLVIFIIISQLGVELVGLLREYLSKLKTLEYCILTRMRG
jgi:hypothetical protein